MKTDLNITIKTEQDAVDFLTALYNNGESFHPEDNAHDIVWHCSTPTFEECCKLNDLMELCYTFDGIDPCGILVDLNK